MKALLPMEVVEEKIFLIRGHRVMLDRDLAGLYGVETKVLNQAVKRNMKRFPKDFMFQLTPSEKSELVTNCDRFKTLKHSTSTPFAFTGQGVAMLSSILNSDRAIEVNIAIMRVFVKLREMIATNKDLAHKLDQHERKIERHDEEIRLIFDAIRQLMTPPEPKRKRIGFLQEKEK